MHLLYEYNGLCSVTNLIHVTYFEELGHKTSLYHSKWRIIVQLEQQISNTMLLFL